jgi:hypothetical protein
VTSSPFAALIDGARTVRTSDEMTSAAVAGARRATLLSKMSLLDISSPGRLTAAKNLPNPAETMQP